LLGLRSFVLFGNDSRLANIRRSKGFADERARLRLVLGLWPPVPGAWNGDFRLPGVRRRRPTNAFTDLPTLRTEIGS
jgi:hypothetical protein